MRIARPLFILSTRAVARLALGLALALSTGLVTLAAQTKYEVAVQTSKPAELAKAKTYVWTPGNPSFDKSVHAMIVAAVDRELAARGFAKLPSGRGDLEVSYATVGRTDVDTKNATKQGPQGSGAEFSVATLIVDMRAASTRDVLFRVRTDTPFARDAATIQATVDAAVAAMFAKYPPPPKR